MKAAVSETRVKRGGIRKAKPGLCLCIRGRHDGSLCAAFPKRRVHGAV